MREPYTRHEKTRRCRFCHQLRLYANWSIWYHERVLRARTILHQELIPVHNMRVQVTSNHLIERLGQLRRKRRRD